mmetsp:Transcript_65930/g.157654  ORF Transcript_65930/g.157654 Transcript_65930/m.157654 type:complete len:392 (-) Transcript_65930:93-1268(-)
MVTAEPTRLREPGFASKGKRLARSSSRGDDGSLPPIREASCARDGSLPPRDSSIHRPRRTRSHSRGPCLGGAEVGARDNSLPPLLRHSDPPAEAVRPPRIAAVPQKVERNNRTPPDASAQGYARKVAEREVVHPKQPEAATSKSGADRRTAGRPAVAPPMQRGGSRERVQPPFAVEPSNTASPPAKRMMAPPPRPPSYGTGLDVQSSLNAPVAPAGVAEVADVSQDLLACPHCQRTFNAKAHAKHVPLCVKVFEKSRKAFKAVEQRMPKEAISANRQAQKRVKAGKAGGGEEKLNSKWRHQSEAFRAAIKDARIVEQYKREGKPLNMLPQPKQTPTELDDRVPCPHCGRRFGQQQAERHIPHCANAKARPAPPPKASQASRSAARPPPPRR